jgi:hypothetical protein
MKTKKLLFDSDKLERILCERCGRLFHKGEPLTVNGYGALNTLEVFHKYCAPSPETIFVTAPLSPSHIVYDSQGRSIGIRGNQGPR